MNEIKYFFRQIYKYPGLKKLSSVFICSVRRYDFWSLMASLKNSLFSAVNKYYALITKLIFTIRSIVACLLGSNFVKNQPLYLINIKVVKSHFKMSVINAGAKMNYS